MILLLTKNLMQKNNFFLNFVAHIEKKCIFAPVKTTTLLLSSVG